MKLKDKTLERIIENENTITKLESICNSMIQELGGCEHHILNSSDARKYGVELGSLICCLLGCYGKIKDKEKTE